MTGCLRVKNEARWIRRVLDSVLPLCDRVLVMDDHSGDETAAIARDCGANVLESPFSGLNEVRDKNWLLTRAAPQPGEWILWIDGDEELYEPDADLIRAAVRDPVVRAWSLRVLYLWDRADQVRTDGVYGNFRRPSLFRFEAGLTFGGTGAGGGFHCSNVPYALWRQSRPCEARLLHYGYMDCEDRIRKYHWYRSRDPHNPAEDNYRHVCQGDLPELPAGAVYKHGGPLTLIPIS